MLRRESSSTVIGNSGWDFAALEPEELQTEVQLVCALYDDGLRLVVKPKTTTTVTAHNTPPRVLLEFQLTLFPQTGTTILHDDDQGANDHGLVMHFVCPLGYLTDGEKLQVNVKTLKTEAMESLVRRVQEAVTQLAEESAATNIPSILTAATIAQQMLDEATAEEPAGGDTQYRPSPDATTVGATTTTAAAVDLDAYIASKMGGHDNDNDDDFATSALDMPYDCWFVVCSFLGPIATARTAAVCSWLYETLNDEGTWEHFFLHHFPTVSGGSIVNGRYGRTFFDQVQQKTRNATVSIQWNFVDTTIVPPAAADPSSDDEDQYSSHDHHYVTEETESSRKGTYRASEIVPKFVWSWAASFRHAALGSVSKWLSRPQRDSFFDVDGAPCADTLMVTDDWDLTDKEKILKVQLRAREDLGERYLLAGTTIPAHIAEALEEEMTNEAGGVEAREWNVMFHRTTNPGVKRIAHVMANYHAHNYNVALTLLRTGDFSTISAKRCARLQFPSTPEDFDAFVSQVRLKSLDSDVENETDATNQQVLRVKHRDYHLPSSQCLSDETATIGGAPDVPGGAAPTRSRDSAHRAGTNSNIRIVKRTSGGKDRFWDTVSRTWLTSLPDDYLQQNRVQEELTCLLRRKKAGFHVSERTIQKLRRQLFEEGV